jgi:hypothetical protein
MAHAAGVLLEHASCKPYARCFAPQLHIGRGAVCLLLSPVQAVHETQICTHFPELMGTTLYCPNIGDPTYLYQGVDQLHRQGGPRCCSPACVGLASVLQVYVKYARKCREHTSW